ncbi:hypothetical protein, partial [Bacteroides fragilis]|uniref:hypothetical protein n=1 Tax=Bacteroides fragilis TaxID=817 RepID=UPI002E7C02CA
LSFMRGIFISCWINHKKRKKLEGTLFGHPLSERKSRASRRKENKSPLKKEHFLLESNHK